MESPMSVIERQLRDSGATLGERHKKLNELVREPPQEILADVTCINKKQVDLVYMGRLANHTKNASLICQLLKSEDSMVVSVALQSKWLFTATTHKDYASVEYFDKEVFPYISYRTLCRIVSTFGACLRDENVAQAMYTYIAERYGKKLAMKLLPKCCVEFIRSQIMDSLRDVPCAQLFYIYKKDKTLALEYLEKYLNKEKANKLPVSYTLKMNYDRIWKQLAEDDPKVFFKLLDKYNNIITVRIGHRAAKGVLKVDVEKVIQNPEKYHQCISIKDTVSILRGKELENYLLNCMPAKEDELSQYDEHFNNLKPEFRLKVLMKLHPAKYNGAAFLDRKDFINWGLCEYLSKEERILWAKKKIQNIKPTDELREDSYLKYLDESDAIPRLQEMCVITTELNKRSTYLEFMVECCKINEDKEALLKLLQHVAKRYRNDNATLRYNFLNKVEQCFPLRDLSADHWAVINEMVDFLNTEQENTRNSYIYFINNVFQEYVHYCLLNGLDIEPSIQKLIDLSTYYTNVVWEMKNKDFELKVLKMFLKKYEAFLTENQSLDQYDRSNIVQSLIQACVERKDKISITEYPWLIDYIKENHKSFESYMIPRIFEEIVKDPKTRSMFLNEVLLYVKNMSVFKNIIMFNGEIAINNMQNFIKESAQFYKRSNNHRVYEKIHTYLMHPLGQKIAEALTELMREDNVKDFQKLGVDTMYLAYLLSSTERNQLIQKNAPTNLKVDLENNRREYQVGAMLGKYMKTLNPPVELDTLIPFIGGDYLKYSLSSLLSLFYRKPRSEALTFIEELLKKPVSIKKHSISTTYFLYPRETLLPLYKSLWETEKNSSIRYVLFSLTFRLLSTEENLNKCQDIWETLKWFISSLNESDIQIFKYLTKPECITPTLVDDYCKICWRTLKELSAQKLDVSTHISTMSKSLDSCITLLSDEFCEQIIKEYLSSVGTKESEVISDLLIFLVDYLVKAKNGEVQSRNVLSACEIFKEYIKINWDKKVDGKYTNRQVVKDFIQKCCTQSLKEKLELSPLNLLRNLNEMLSSALPMPHALELHIALRATTCYKELLLDPRFAEYSSEDTAVSSLECHMMSSFGKKISIHLNDFCSQYGVAVTEVYAILFSKWLQILLNENKRSRLELHFISGLLSGNVTQQCFIMAVHCISVEHPNDTDDLQLYNQILSRILKESDVSVRIILDMKIEQGFSCFSA